MKGALLALVLAPVFGCLWDSTTLSEEVRGMPEAETLVVTGRWPRHGEAYWKRRTAVLPARLEAHPDDLDAFDDLAVARERLGDHDGAVALMDRKARALQAHPDPDHLYRMHANRGTFLAHAGRYDEALAELAKALELNPDAHFGRERYQVDAIRYVRDATTRPGLWSAHDFLTWAGWEDAGGLGAIGEWSGEPGGEPAPTGNPGALDRDAALAGIEGMLRFGGREGAELYRAWGDIQWGRRNRHLAWWAYHRALDRGHPAVGALRSAIGRIETYWNEAGMVFPPTEGTWERMRRNGEAWLAGYQAAEAAAIDRGEDPDDDAVVAGLIEEADDAAGGPPFATTFSPRNLFTGRNAAGLILLAAVVVVAGLLAWDRRRKRRAASVATAGSAPPAPAPPPA